MKLRLFLLLPILLLAACATPEGAQDGLVGGALGAITGAALGGGRGAIAGAALGAAAGGAYGDQDTYQRQYGGGYYAPPPPPPPAYYHPCHRAMQFGGYDAYGQPCYTPVTVCDGND